MAWHAGWNPSFDGVAIINEDFTFRSVNPQFCELLGVTQAQLIGHSFEDVTPLPQRVIEKSNATLLKQGVMDFFVMKKSFDFGDGMTRQVVLLVTRVPSSAKGPFQFFLSRIMLDAEEPSMPEQTGSIELHTTHQENTSWNMLDFLQKYYKILIAVGLTGGAFFYSIFNGGIK